MPYGSANYVDYNDRIEGLPCGSGAWALDEQIVRSRRCCIRRRRGSVKASTAANTLQSCGKEEDDS
jgi:hypothetical protein